MQESQFKTSWAPRLCVLICNIGKRKVFSLNGGLAVLSKQVSISWVQVIIGHKRLASCF